MPDIGTGGGMKLSVGIGLNLTGFEALTQIAKELEVLQQMAMKTEQAFASMGNALRQTMNIGTAEMGRAADRMERASRTTSRASPIPLSPIMGTTEERFAARYENTDFDLRARQHARALRDSERAIRAEAETREKAWQGLRTGVLGTLGVSAAFGLMEAGKSFIHAAAQMDDRRASMRLQGLDPTQAARMTGMALQANVPGLDLAEKVRLGQQIGTAVGVDKVTPESMRTIATMARAITQLTGGDLKETIDHLVQASQSAGNLIGPKGLEAGRLGNNAEAIEHIMALAPGRITLDHLNEMLGAGRAGLQGLDLAHNESLQSHVALLAESKGVTPKNFNQLLRFLQGGIDQSHLGLFAQAGLLKMEPGGVLPSTNPLTGKTNVRAVDLLNIPKTGDPLDFFPMAVAKLHEKFPQIPIQNLINTAFPTDIARGVSALATPTAMEEHQRNLEARKRQPEGTEAVLKATESFNQAIRDIGAAFREFAQVVGAPMMQDAAKIIELIAHGLHGLSVVLGALGPVLPILTRLAEVLALLAGIRFLGGRLAARTAGAAAGARAGLTGAGAVESMAGGALLGRAMSGGAAKTGMMAQMLDPEFAVGGAIAATKAGAMKIAGRGLTAFLVTSIADSVVDSFTTEGSNANALIKDVIEGSAIGATVAGWPGAIIGAILDPVVRGAAKGLKQATDTTEQYQKEHLSETYVDPYSGTVVSGLTNADAQHIPLGNASTIAHLNNEREFENTQATRAERSARRHQTGPRQMTVTHSSASMLPPTGPVTQTDFDSPLAQVLAAQHEKQLLNRSVNPLTPPNLISPTGGAHAGAGVNPPFVGATPAIPMTGSQPTQSETLLPSLKVSTIETNMLIVRGGGGQPQVGTNAREGTTPSNVGTTPPGLPKSSVTTTSTNMVAGQPVTPGSPLSPTQMGAIDFGMRMGNAYPPDIMAQYNQQKGIAQAPSALQSAPGEPVAGLGAMAGSAPQTGVTPGIPTPGAPTASGIGGAKPVSTDDRMAGHQRSPTGMRVNADSTSPANTPSALQSVAPGEPVAGLGAMAGSTPQTGVAPGIPTPGAPTASGIGGAKPVSTGDRMAGHQRSPTGIRGSTATAPAFTGAQQKDAAAASVKFWMSKGLTKNQAAGMAAQEIKESGGNPRAVGDGGLAHGLYQHHPDRIAAIKAGTGIDMLTADANQQREGAFWEMMHTEKAAWQGLKATSTPQDAGAAGSLLFERPRDRMGEAFGRGALAGRIAMDVPNVQGPQVNPEQADVPASHMTVHINSQHMLDGDMIADHMATHFIGGGATAATSATGYDSKQHPLAPGVSVPRW